MPVLSIPYPMINGRRYSWASVAVAVGTTDIIGFKSINYNDKLDPTKIHGTGQSIIGHTAGMYDADADCEIYTAEADLLIAALGDGWGNVVLPIQVQYFDDEMPTVTDLLSVRLTGRTKGGSESSDALTTKFTLFVVDTILSNGVGMVPPIANAGLSVIIF